MKSRAWRGLVLLPTLVLAFTVAPGCGDDDGTADSGPPGDGPSGLDILYDETFSGSCLESLRCPSTSTASACACVPIPNDEEVFVTNRVGCAELESGTVTRTPEEDFCQPGEGDTPPALGCMMPGMYRTRGAPMAVTVYGVVDVFGNGSDATGIVVEVYRVGTDGALGELVGMSSPSDIAHGCAEDEIEYRNDEPAGTRTLGYYEISGVPTETPLILKQSSGDGSWTDLYTYNFEIANSEIDSSAPMPMGDCTPPVGPRFRYKARILSSSDYDSIPLTAGLIGGVTEGNGGVAGEIHDCDDVRLEFAQVGVTPTPSVLTYFSDDPDNPLPVPGRVEGTSRLGLYAGLDLPPGPVDVAALGRVGGQVVSLGWFRAQIFPDSVSVVTLRGLRPEQTGGGGT